VENSIDDYRYSNRNVFANVLAVQNRYITSRGDNFNAIEIPNFQPLFINGLVYNETKDKIVLEAEIVGSTGLVIIGATDADVGDNIFIQYGF
tara:strand:+ start:2275 stop:2550 length:276 start_codon:yes stop_codon:yes gene_type:complete